MKTNRWIIAAILIFVLGVGLFILQDEIGSRIQVWTTPKASEATDWKEHYGQDESAPQSTELNLAMPFFSQAPEGNWDYPWQEACEEASLLLIANVYKDMKLDAKGFSEEILKMVDYENETFGDYKDTNAVQTAQILKDQYNLESVVHDNPSFEDMQAILDKGHFIIGFFAGKSLGNPNYRNGGPVYHVLVIKGYNATKRTIVTNDVGTRNGSNYVYTWDVIENALHDWNPDNIQDGTPRILEVLP